jgi:gliding motility-associated-like protein
MIRFPFIIIILAQLFNGVQAQVNLVPNPSFEEVSTCVNPFSHIDTAVHWYSVLWTPDIFHSCFGDSSDYHGVPNNKYGYQEPRTGFAYAGFYSYSMQDWSNEILGVQLKTPLKKNSKYFIRYFVVATHQSIQTDGFGLAFSDTTLKLGRVMGEEILPDLPLAIGNPSNNIIEDTIVWQSISGCYIARGWEKNLVIGNLLTNEQTQITNTQFENRAYYLIDDVGIYEFDPLPDTIFICGEEEIKIGSKFLNAEYQWNTGATDSVIYINKEGKYYVDVLLHGNILSDTVNVIDINRKNSELFRDTSICNDADYLTIELPVIGQYDWSDDIQRNNGIVNLEEGLYRVTVTNECGMNPYSFRVKKKACGIFVPNTFTPNGDGINDLFKPITNSPSIQVNSLKIFDRWGSCVFNSHNEFSWNGKHRDSKSNNGVYLYIIEYHDGAELHQITGTVTLIK